MERTPTKTGFRVLVAYGTSQKLTTLRSGEFVIRKDASQAFKLSGLSFDGRFSFASCVELDYSDTWFQVPPAAPQGQCPKLGVLHAVYAKAAYAAWQACGL